MYYLFDSPGRLAASAGGKKQNDQSPCQLSCFPSLHFVLVCKIHVNGLDFLPESESHLYIPVSIIISLINIVSIINRCVIVHNLSLSLSLF